MNQAFFGIRTDMLKYERSLFVDGNDEYINIDSVQSSLSSTSVGTWGIWVKPIDATPVSNSPIIGFGDTDAESRLLLFNDKTGQLRFIAEVNGTVEADFKTSDVVFVDDTWIYVSVNSDYELYVNGILVDLDIDTLNSQPWFSDIPGLDNGRIASINFNSGGEAIGLNAYLYKPHFFDSILSADELSYIAQNPIIDLNKDEGDYESSANLVSWYKMGGDARDNYNDVIVNEWFFQDIKGSNNAEAVNCEEADVTNDVPNRYVPFVLNLDSETKRYNGLDLINLEGDGDNLIDLITGTMEGDVFVFEQNPANTFTANNIFTTGGNQFSSVRGYDWDSDGDYEIISLNKTDGKIRIHKPDTLGDAFGSYTTTELITGRPFLQAMFLHDFDADGFPSVCYSWEGTVNGEGGIHKLRFTGSDPENPAHWTDSVLIQHNGAWGLNGVTDIEGVGNDDIYFTARKSGRNAAEVPGVYWLRESGGYSLETITNETEDWGHLTIGDFTSNGNNKDLVVSRGDGGGGTTGIFLYDYADSFSETELFASEITGKPFNVWNTGLISGKSDRDEFFVVIENDSWYFCSYRKGSWTYFILQPTVAHPADSDIYFQDINNDSTAEYIYATGNVGNGNLRKFVLNSP